MARVVRDASERANALVDALLLLARSEAQSGRRLVRKVPSRPRRRRRRRRCPRWARRCERLSLRRGDRPRPGAGGGRPRPAGAPRRQPGGERRPVQPPARADPGPHRRGRAATPRWWSATPGFEVEPADVPGLFEPFRRGGRERTGARGAGLGLSIVRAVVRRARRDGAGQGAGGRRRPGGDGDPAGRRHHAGGGRDRHRALRGPGGAAGRPRPGFEHRHRRPGGVTGGPARRRRALRAGAAQGQRRRPQPVRARPGPGAALGRIPAAGLQDPGAHRRRRPTTSCVPG